MLGFLVKTYPKISETFVLQEILELQKEPFGLNIFSMQRPSDDKLHQAFSSVTAKVYYLTPEFWKIRAAVKTHLYFIGCRFWPYFNTLAFTLYRPEEGGFGRFCQAVYLAWLVQEKGIVHIHAHFASEPAGLAALVAKLSGITFSISAHAKDIYLQNHACLRRKISLAQFVVTCTEYNRRYLDSINTSKTPVFRLYHGLDCSRVLTENSRTIAASEIPRILSVGRLREKKGFPTLIAACQLLLQAGYGFQCDIVGYGPDREKLERLIAAYGLQNKVRLLGKLTHDKLVALYRQSAVFALPCQIGEDGDRDGIPNVLMEAMIFAIPVVSSNVSGIPELVKNNQTGLVTESKNPQALFVALQRLLDNPGLRRQLGEAGRRCVMSQFSVHQHIGPLKELLASALRRNHCADRFAAATGEQHG